MTAFSESDYPNVYQAADQASKTAQSNYLLFVAIDLISMVVASLLSIYSFNEETVKLVIYIISAVFLLMGLIFSIILLTKKYESTWYQGRALAESCKTLTWRFMMRSELFEDALTLDEAKRRFVDRIQQLNDEFKDLSNVMSSKLLSKPVWTPTMIQIRSLSLSDRKSYYISERINNQQSWYSDKADFNKLKYNFWFAIIIISQAVSLITIGFLIKYPLSSWTVVGVFTTLPSAAISWLQLKQHQGLKQAYTTAAQELNFIAALSDQVNSDDAFSKFVLDSENAISREHTLWLAQKRI